MSRAEAMNVAGQEDPDTSFATLSVDVHGGDYGPEVTVPAAISALARDSKINIVLVGQQLAIESALAKAHSSNSARLGMHYAAFTTRLDAMLVKPALRQLLAELDPSAHNGAPLLGLRSVVLKSHGGADCESMTQAILEAGREARRCVPQKIEESIRAFKLETDA